MSILNKLVTIAMPVRNEVKYVAQSLASVVDTGAKIIVSDNASTDGTSEICEKFAEKYPNIEYYRHAENIGLATWSFCIDKANTEFFTFLAGHDLTDHKSLLLFTSSLQNNPDAAVAFGQHIMINTSGNVVRVLGEGEPYEKCASYEVTERFPLATFGHSDAIFYGSVWRKCVLEKEYAQVPLKGTLGFDRILRARAAAYNRFIYVPEAWCCIRNNHEATKEQQLARWLIGLEIPKNEWRKPFYRMYADHYISLINGLDIEVFKKEMIIKKIIDHYVWINKNYNLEGTEKDFMVDSAY